jgi:2-polyprenyl-3-methyl-5-hydroxy-6-metoxy-1,4-benzoquinol methylase
MSGRLQVKHAAYAQGSRTYSQCLIAAYAYCRRKVHRAHRAFPWRWTSQENEMTAGLPYLRRAIGLSVHRRKALDVGCGSGGRVINALLDGGFDVTGLDVSQAMVGLAEQHHPTVRFLRADICEWEPEEQYDLIVAWG